MASFLPNTDGALLAWSLNFVTRLQASPGPGPGPGPYGLTPEQCAGYGAVHALFAQTLAACGPQERNRIATVAKNSARAALQTQARLLAKLVEGTASVTDAQKAELGLRIRGPRTAVPPPEAAPALLVVAAMGNTVKLRLLDAANSTSRAKPPGVDGASLFSFVGPEAPTRQGDWHYEDVTSKTVVDITFPPTIPPGSRVWFTAVWFNRRKESGPAARAVGTCLPGGAAMAA